MTLRLRIACIATLFALLPFAAAAQEEAAPAEASAETSEPSPSAKPAIGEKQVVIEKIDPLELEILEKTRMVVALTDKLRPRTSRYLSRAQKEVDEENAKEAERLLLKIQNTRLNDLEKAYVYRFLGFLAFNDERPEDAIKYFGQALEMESMQVREDTSLRFGIAQLHMSVGEWQKAIDWFNKALYYTLDVDANNLYVMALAYFQLKDFESAVGYTKKAIEISSPPQEAWLRLLSALYAQTEQYAKAIPVLEELVLRYPERSYWVQLSLMYAAHEEYATSLAVQQAAHAQDFLTESKELMRFARSFLYHDLPFGAAQVLATELESGRIEKDHEAYELLANSYIAAREYDKSLPPLQEAAQLAEDGKLYVRLGQVHMQREEWPEAVENLRKAFDKGIPEKVGNAQVLLGIAYLNQERTAEAEAAFQRARQHEDSRDEADRWLEHIAKEAERAQS